MLESFIKIPAVAFLLLVIAKGFQPEHKITPGIYTKSATHQYNARKAKKAVPNLVGLTLSEAISKLNERKLNVGIMVADEEVKTVYLHDLKVYLQNPKPIYENGEIWYIKKGQQVDVWLTDNQVKVDSAKSVH